ncbi:hypothetical protein [Fretibacter rubidus]|uniref:hypothetical protein n=1 Tax=Fretibacter rubidus TaxID=570162 RepID=UPI003529ECCF
MWRAVVITALIVAAQPAFASDNKAPVNDETTIAADTIRAFESNSTDVFSIFQILLDARAAYDAQDFAQALTHYSIIVKYDDTIEEAVVGLTKSYLAMGQADAAKTVLDKTPLATTEVQILRVMSASMAAPHESAKTILQSGLAQHDDARLWNLLGNKHAGERAWAEASFAFMRAEKAGQRPGLLLNNLGLLALQKGELEQAEAYLSRAVEHAPQTQKFDSNRRLVLLLNGSYMDALDNLDRDRAANLIADAAVIASRRGDAKLADFLRRSAAHYNPLYNPKLKNSVDS